MYYSEENAFYNKYLTMQWLASLVNYVFWLKNDLYM